MVLLQLVQLILTLKRHKEIEKINIFQSKFKFEVSASFEL